MITVIQSEKKFNTKAASEYKKHLLKLVHDEHAPTLTRTKSEDEKSLLASRLDGLKLEASSSETAGTTSSTAPLALERPTFAATPPPQPIGSLSVKSVEVGSDDQPEENTPITAAALDAMKLMSKPTSKKATSSKKSTVKKLSTNSERDVAIESFESVDRRAVKAAQEEEDRKLALQLSREINAPDSGASAAGSESSGRVAAMMMESEAGSASPAKPSIYRSSPATSASSGAPATVFTGSGRYGNLGNYGSNSSNNSSSRAPESREARDRYGNVKGISSDQYFGRDDEAASVQRSNLQNYSGSKAISSDMLRGGGDAYSSGAGNDNSLDRLKDSVSGFFDSIGGKR